MAVCMLTGKSWMNANRISHSNIKTKRRLKANIQKKRFFDVETGRFVTLRISMKALRMLSKKSLSKVLG